MLFVIGILLFAASGNCFGAAEQAESRFESDRFFSEEDVAQLEKMHDVQIVRAFPKRFLVFQRSLENKRVVLGECELKLLSQLLSAGKKNIETYFSEREAG